MIKHIGAHSVNEALFQGLYHIGGFGDRDETRNGPALVSPMPVVTTYYHPERRVLINQQRDANPFFHLFEALWMLAGRNDLAFPQKFVSTFGRFSDDGETLHGAYGYRWRNYFGHDQLEEIIQELKANPSTRRAVLQMWDGHADLGKASAGGKDVPCNTTAFFDTIGGKLNLNVMCRSNDVVLGAYGANAVHFSMLLEYVACMTGIPMGVYRQFSTNFHLYLELYPNLTLKDKTRITSFANSVNSSCPYSVPGVLSTRDYSGSVVTHMPLMQPLGIPAEQQAFHEDLEAFMEFDLDDMETTFFKHVVAPMYSTWSAWKAGDFAEAKHLALSIRADDWRLAAQDWLAVREARRNGEA